MSAFRRTLTTLAALLTALGTLIALSFAALAQPAPLPDDTYPAPSTPATSTASHLWVFFTLAVIAITLVAVLAFTKRRHAQYGRTVLA
ncbi:MAG: hypothetical protein ABI808_08515 [Pseudonocardiales bacterium]